MGQQNKTTKEAVATHEAGHALITLNTPLQDYIESVRVFFECDEWRGEHRMSNEDRSKVDPKGVYEFAKGLGGPMAQIYFYPNSIDAKLSKMIDSSGSLLRAIREIIKKKIPLNDHWLPDLTRWIQFCRADLPLKGEKYLQVENEISRILSSNPGQDFVRNMSNKLNTNGSLGVEELKKTSVKKIPKFDFPDDLSSRLI